MLICTPVVVYRLILRVMMMMNKMFQDMDGEDLKECRSLNIMLFNYTSVMVYSLLFFMRVDYVKNIALMLGFAPKPIVFNGYGQIKRSYEQTVTMGFKMRSEQELRKMRIDWDVKSSSLHLSLALLDI